MDNLREIRKSMLENIITLLGDDEAVEKLYKYTRRLMNQKKREEVAARRLERKRTREKVYREMEEAHAEQEEKMKQLEEIEALRVMLE